MNDNKFLATVVGVIVTAIIFGILYFLIPLISAVLSVKPLYLSIFICGIIILISLFSIRMSKTKYLKIMPVVLAVVLGSVVVGDTAYRFYDSCYNRGFIFNNWCVYDSLGNPLYHCYWWRPRFVSDSYGNIMIATKNRNETYSIYTFDGICVDDEAYGLDGYNYISDL